MADYLFEFPESPPIGTIVVLPKNCVLTLIGSEPYQKKDSEQLTLLFWRDQKGRIGCSSLRSKEIIWGYVPKAMRDLAE